MKKFGDDQPCSVTVTLPDGAPAFLKDSDEEHFALNANIDLQIQCVPKDSTSGDFEQALTLEVNLDTTFDLGLAYSVLVKFDLLTLNLKYV